MINPAARGNAVLLGLGVERSFGIPQAGSLVGYAPILPVDGSLGATRTDSPQVNRTGYLRAGMPGNKGGSAFELHHPLTGGHALEFLQHLKRSNEADGSLVKTELEAGVYRYVFEPVLEGVDTSFFAVIGRPPVDIALRYGIKFGTWTIPLGEGVLPQDLVGVLQHGTDLGPADPAVANTGTYVLGPWARGPLKDPSAGSVWVRVVSLAPLVFKVLQSSDEPLTATWDAAATTFMVATDSSGQAVWQPVHSSATGLDLGIVGEDKDPLELVFPGAAADHADLAVDDVFELPVTWAAPALSTISGHQRYTKAHWLSYVREVGAGAWIEVLNNSGQIGFATAVEPARGNNSKYPHTVDRIGEATPTLQLVRDYRDRWFRDRQGQHVEVRQVLEGQQLGSGAHRESVEVVYPFAEITAWQAPAADSGKIVETVDLVGHTDDSGNPPVTVTVITSRDWTPAT